MPITLMGNCEGYSIRESVGGVLDGEDIFTGVGVELMD
jgi:hypothetical protein